MGFVDVFDVTYKRHEIKGKAPSLKVLYLCPRNIYVEFVYLEGYGLKRIIAENWWSHRAPGGVVCPTTVIDAMNEIDLLRIPERIKVYRGYIESVSL